MRKILSIFLLVIIPQINHAQIPKLHLKAIGGYNAHVYPQYKNDVMHGWHLGFGIRVTQKRFMAETDLLFMRNSVSVIVQDSINHDQFTSLDFDLRTKEIPFKLGYLPIKTPYIKWYCYTGTILRLKTKGYQKTNDGTIKFNPMEIGFDIPNVDFILGTQVDIKWLNLDFTYSLGMRDSMRDHTSTSSHELQLSAGILF